MQWFDVSLMTYGLAMFVAVWLLAPGSANPNFIKWVILWPITLYAAIRYRQKYGKFPPQVRIIYVKRCNFCDGPLHSHYPGCDHYSGPPNLN